MSIEAKQVLELIIRPTLSLMGMDSESAERLVLYTGAVESGYDRLRQVPSGPALGWWQMERIAYKHNCLYVQRHPQMHQKLLATCFMEILPPFETLVWNLRLACAMARIQYWQNPEPLPDEDDLQGLGNYWLKYYNRGGAGSLERFVDVCEDLL